MAKKSARTIRPASPAVHVNLVMGMIGGATRKETAEERRMYENGRGSNILRPVGFPAQNVAPRVAGQRLI